MTSYLCKRCSFTGKNFCDIRRHLNKKKICSKIIQNFNHSDEYLLALSLIPEAELELLDVTNFKGDKNILNNKKILFEKIAEIEKLKSKECSYCHATFHKIQDLKNHVILTCFSNKLNKNSHVTIDGHNNINIEGNENNIHNNINKITNNYINNNITINLNLDSLISFDKDWDISHITKATKQALVLSLVKYTQTLEYILKNENNLNVLLDKSSDKGFIYKDNHFKEMNKTDIIDESFKKIYNQLNDFCRDIKANNEFNLDTNLLNMHRKNIEQKFNKYYEDEPTKKMVQACITEKFEHVKEKAHKNYEKVNNVIGF
jgi:hypothetical protein